jgi:phosphoglycolate phosphatase
MKYKAVLFDMDGTVLDTLGDLAAAVNHTLREFSMPERSIAEVAAALSNGAAYLIAHTVPAGTPKELTDKVLAAYAPYYDAHCDILTGPYDGIVPLMEKLRDRGVKLAVISNKQDTAVKPLAEKYFPGLLEIAVGESTEVRRKPNPDAVLAALRHIGVEREDAIYVGDTEVDLQTARNAGMECASVDWGFRTREQLVEIGAEHIFDTVQELEEYLLKN